MIFGDEKEAYSFCADFNGKIITDGKGNKSMAIVERAPNQSISDKNDTMDSRVGTLKNEFEYLKFLDEYNEFNTKKVIDFEALVRELEEKRKRLAEGAIQETPLIEYLVEQNIKKGSKRRRKILKKCGKVMK